MAERGITVRTLRGSLLLAHYLMSALSFPSKAP